MRNRFGLQTAVTTALTMLAIAALATTASAQPGTKSQSGSVRIVNLIPDSDSLTMYVQHDTTADLRLAFHDAGAITHAVSTAPFHITVAPSGTGSAAGIIDSDIAIANDTLTTAAIVGRTADKSARLTLLLTDPLVTPPSGYSIARLLQASPDLGPVDVEMIPSSGSSEKFMGVDFGQATSYAAIAGGDCLLKIYRAGTDDPMMTVYATMPTGQVITAIIDGEQSASTLGVDALFDAAPVAQTPLTSLPISLAAVRGSSSSTGAMGVLTVTPNPTRDRTTLAYHLAERSDVTIRIFDALGAQVAAMPLGMQQAGNYTAPLTLDALPAGIYQAVLQRDGAPVATARIAVVR